MPVAARSELFVALDHGDAEMILGTAETSWLDFKQQPYVLARSDPAKIEQQRLELAKDVSALASSGGGVLVIGFATRPETSTAQDIAHSWARVPEQLIDANKYAGTVAALTYPPLAGLVFKWWMIENAAGIFTIEVPAVSDADGPIIVTKVIDEQSQSGLLVGIFQRPGDSVSALTPGQIHTQIQLGRYMQRGGLAFTPPAQSLSFGPSMDERQERLALDTRDSGLSDHRRYFLQAWPTSETEVLRLHDRGSDGMRTILSRPPSIRPSGFGLRTGIEPEIIPGGGLRIVSRRESLSLLPDGLFTWVASAGSDFLAWADERRGHPLSINPIALVESTLEFARLYIEQVLKNCSPSPVEWALAGGLMDLHEDSSPTSLGPGVPQDWLFEDPTPIPAEAIIIPERHFPRDVQPGRVAFDVIRRIYGSFGLPESEIPFTLNDEVNEKAIISAR